MAYDPIQTLRANLETQANMAKTLGWNVGRGLYDNGIYNPILKPVGTITKGAMGWASEFSRPSDALIQQAYNKRHSGEALTPEEQRVFDWESKTLGADQLNLGPLLRKTDEKQIAEHPIDAGITQAFQTGSLLAPFTKGLGMLPGAVHQSTVLGGAFGGYGSAGIGAKVQDRVLSTVAGAVLAYGGEKLFNSFKGMLSKKYGAGTQEVLDQAKAWNDTQPHKAQFVKNSDPFSYVSDYLSRKDPAEAKALSDQLLNGMPDDALLQKELINMYGKPGVTLPAPTASEKANSEVISQLTQKLQANNPALSKTAARVQALNQILHPQKLPPLPDLVRQPQALMPAYDNVAISNPPPTQQELEAAKNMYSAWAANMAQDPDFLNRVAAGGLPAQDGLDLLNSSMPISSLQQGAVARPPGVTINGQVSRAYEPIPLSPRNPGALKPMSQEEWFMQLKNGWNNIF